MIIRILNVIWGDQLIGGWSIHPVNDKGGMCCVQQQAHSSALVRKKMEEMRLKDAWLGIAKPLLTPFLEMNDD